MMGGVMGGDVEKVRDLEAATWGTTDAASQLRIRVCNQKLQTFDPNNVKDYEKQRNGLIYLSFPYLKYEKLMKSQRWIRPYIKPSSSFVLTLSFDGSLQPVVESTVWLLTHFGGLGGRTRRGFGSVAVDQTGSDGLAPGFLSYQPDPNADLKDYYKKNIEAIREASTTFAQRKLSSHFSAPASGASPLSVMPQFSSFADWRTVLIEVSKSDWKEILDLIGKELRGFREDPAPAATIYSDKGNAIGQRTFDYMGAVAAFYNAKLSSTASLDYDAFGLPIQYQSSSRGRAKVSLQWRYQNDDKLQDRRASPLIIRPLKFDSRDKWCIAFHLFRSEFLPKNAMERLIPAADWPSGVSKPSAVDVQVARFTKVDAFLDQIKKDYSGVELP
jgi:CRISPR type III-B/RAMP module RAMP protein Cmr1